MSAHDDYPLLADIGRCDDELCSQESRKALDEIDRLRTLWAAVHGGIPYDYPALGRQVLDELRAIGGAQ